MRERSPEAALVTALDSDERDFEPAFERAQPAAVRAVASASDSATRLGYTTPPQFGKCYNGKTARSQSALPLGRFLTAVSNSYFTVANHPLPLSYLTIGPTAKALPL
ncbi:hypothetical protein M3583_23530, partial [Bacillus subtilis]|nr:hypothetical protein [Bacillus subtilis]